MLLIKGVNRPSWVFKGNIAKPSFITPIVVRENQSLLHFTIVAEVFSQSILTQLSVRRFHGKPTPETLSKSQLRMKENTKNIRIGT